MIKISVHNIKITFLAGVICSNFIGLAFAQTPVLLGPGAVTPITDSGIAPVTSTSTTTLPGKPYVTDFKNWHGMPGWTGKKATRKFYYGYYSNPAGIANKLISEFQASCTTQSLTEDDKKKILSECKDQPVPNNLICAAKIVAKLLSVDGSNVCRHHTVMMIEAAQTLGFDAYLNGGHPPRGVEGDGHAWTEVIVDGQRYIIDAHGSTFISMDGPIAPYCGNNVAEEGEQCDGTSRSNCNLSDSCESCVCKPEGYIMRNPKKSAAIAGLALGTAILLSKSSDSTTNDTEPDSSGTPETTEPETEQPAEVPTEPIGDSRDGNYSVSTSVASNPANHPILIQNLILQIQIIDAVMTITQISNNNNFPRRFTAALTAGAFNAIANGNYAGFSTIFQLVGTINTLNQLTFQLIVGGNGSLPTGQPISYNAQGSK